MPSTPGDVDPAVAGQRDDGVELADPVALGIVVQP